MHSPVMAGPWFDPSSTLLVQVQREEHRDGHEDGQDGVESILDAGR